MACLCQLERIQFGDLLDVVWISSHFSVATKVTVALQEEVLKMFGVMLKELCVLLRVSRHQ